MQINHSLEYPGCVCSAAIGVTVMGPLPFLPLLFSMSRCLWGSKQSLSLVLSPRLAGKRLSYWPEIPLSSEQPAPVELPTPAKGGFPGDLLHGACLLRCRKQVKDVAPVQRQLIKCTNPMKINMPL